MAEGTMSIVRKTSFSPKSTWIKFDATGHGSIINVDKYDIMRQVQIHARDLRILDPLLSYPSTILAREKVLVLNLEVLLQDPTDEDVVPVVQELQRRLPAITIVTNQECPSQHGIEVEVDESPFEFRALEIVLEAICSFLDARTTELEMAAYPALDELTTKVHA
ncbi:hypothetical protein SESBI_07130 [Sesbania bispinosa]|nr:hypothetical protein SESBI_07130 [Sesbania bispinosa]